MKHYSVVMAGSFVNQKLGELPPFIPQRDQGRLVWLTDGTFWFGSDYRWVGISLPDPKEAEDMYSDLLRTTIFLNASYDAFIDESLVENTTMAYRKSEAWYDFVVGNFIQSKNLFDTSLDIGDVEYALVYAHYDGIGTPTIQFSSNGGTNWQVIQSLKVFRIDHTVAGKDLRLRFTAGGTGKLTSWGVLYNKDLTAACTKYGLTYKRFEAHQDQTFFEVAYTSGAEQVFVNGDLLDNTDYFATNGTDITFVTPLSEGDIVYIVSFSTSISNTTDYIKYDGTVTYIQNQPMGGYRLINTGDGVDPGDSVNMSQLVLKANIDSPSLTGTPMAPTVPLSANDDRIATTKFVKDQGYSLSLSNGSSLVWSIVNSSTTITTGNGYFIDTTTGPVTITLPATATIGDTIGIADYTGTFGTNNCIINRNGHNIMGVIEDFTCDTNDMSIKFIYVDATEGWRVADTSDTAGSGGLIWTTISTNTTAAKNYGYFVDTTTGPVTLAFPATAKIGDTIGITDYTGTFTTNNCIIDRNGHNIMGHMENFACDFDNMAIKFTYVDATEGWRVTDTADGQGGGSGTGSSLTWSTISTNTSLNVSNGYFVDTSSGVVTVTLPVTALSGDVISITDYAGTFGTNNCVINRNGHNILGVASDLVCDINHLSIELIYSDATQGWKISETFASGTTPSTITGGIAWDSVTTTDDHAVSGNGYFVDTTAGIVTITLPASPSFGDTVKISDYAGTWDVNNCIIIRNGNNIMGITENLDCNIKGAAVELTFVDGTRGWNITNL